jgi:hypothetical protein
LVSVLKVEQNAGDEDAPIRTKGALNASLVRALILTLATVACIAVALVVGFRWGAATKTTTAYCLSAPGAITCTANADGTGSDYVVRRDVAWSDRDGVTHEGRPECLPPVGRGNIMTTFQFEPVSVDGIEQNVAVFVYC